MTAIARMPSKPERYGSLVDDWGGIRDVIEAESGVDSR